MVLDQGLHKRLHRISQLALLQLLVEQLLMVATYAGA